MENARRDRRSGLWLGGVGLGAAGALVLLAVGTGLSLRIEMRVVIVLLMVAIYGIGRGSWLLFDAHRRLVIIDRVRQPPTARVVRKHERSGS
jgi:hypothetical protein